MSITHRQILNLAQLRDFIDTQDTLAIQARREISSGIKRFCEICGLEPSQIAADPMAIRCLRGNASWQIAGITEQAWRNILSRLTRALELAGIDVDRRRRRSPLVPEWAAFLQLLPDADSFKRLRRLAGWCSSRGIIPEKVTQETFAAFFVYLDTQSVQRNVRERWQEARRAWNKVVATPASGFPNIENSTPARWSSRPLADFSPALQGEVAAWKKWAASPSFDEDRDPLRPITIRNYERAIRRYMSKLIEDGFAPEDFPGLASLLETARIKRAVDRLRAERADAANASVHVTVHALFSVLRYVEVQPDHPRYTSQQEALAILCKVAKKVRNRQTTMVKKNKTRLAALSSPEAARLFRTLHLKVAQRYAKVAKPTIPQALEMQSAAMHMLLLHVPLRIANISRLDLDRHIIRSPGGKPGPWRIAFDGSEMKNGRPYDGALMEEASAYLADYLARFHPVIAQGRSAYVFPSSRTGLRKSEESLSKQYSGFIFRELGLRVNPHLLRHYAGFQWLEHLPGEYTALSRLLAHSSSKTTEAFYTGAETKTAQTRWQGMLGEMIAQDKAVMVQRPSKGTARQHSGETL